jgi:hypothetical protein
MYPQLVHSRVVAIPKSSRDPFVWSIVRVYLVVGIAWRQHVFSVLVNYAVVRNAADNAKCNSVAQMARSQRLSGR